MTLKEYISKAPKEEVYAFYSKIILKPKNYESISRVDIYNELISKYKENPEVILNLCTLEEIESLKNLINEKELYDNHGYLEYVVATNLKNNYLILKDDKYYIPSDIKNYVKMALNVYDSKSYSFRDVTDSVILGISRIYNVVSVKEFINMLAKHFINIGEKDLKKYIETNPKLAHKISVTRYQKEDYVISLEYYHFKDILALRKDYFRYKDYTLEEVISVGKYKINLFKEEVFSFLNFLENHLDPKYIDLILNDLIIYAGFDLKEEETLNFISDNITELLQEIKKVLIYFPIWIYKGNTSETINKNIILPDKNAPCICGSGKKFKHCCRKKYKNINN